MSIGTEICNYYRNVVAPTTMVANQQDSYRDIFPISRVNFSCGAVFAIVFLVQKIALSTFYLAGTVLTLGLHKGIRDALLRNVKDGLAYAGAIPLGILGIFFPQTINRTVLEIPADGLRIPI
jgi:hypothetical protein